MLSKRHEPPAHYELAKVVFCDALPHLCLHILEGGGEAPRTTSGTILGP